MNLFFTKLFGPPIWFDPDDGGGSDAGNDAGSGSGNDNGAPDAGTNGPAFTAEQQAQIDKIVASARREGMSKGGERKLAELLEKLGVEDVDSAVDKIKAARDAENANKTEVERLQSENDNLRDKIEKTESESERRVRAANLRVLRSDIRTEARKQGVREDALADVPALLDLDSLLESLDDETGAFAGVEAAVKTLIADREYLVDTTGDGDGVGTPRPDGRKKRKKGEMPAGPLVRF